MGCAPPLVQHRLPWESPGSAREGTLPEEKAASPACPASPAPSDTETRSPSHRDLLDRMRALFRCKLSLCYCSSQGPLQAPRTQALQPPEARVCWGFVHGRGRLPGEATRSPAC